MRAMRKILNIFILQLPISYILEQKISTGEFERVGSILPSSSYGHLPNYWSNELAFRCLVDEYFYLFLLQLNEMTRLGESTFLSFFFLVLIRWIEEGRWFQDLFLLSLGFESFCLQLPRERWHKLVRVDCLSMIKLMVVGFCSNRCYCYFE